MLKIPQPRKRLTHTREKIPIHIIFHNQKIVFGCALQHFKSHLGT